ncbi:MAG: glycosyltransferase [Acidobacteriota bacterium]
MRLVVFSSKTCWKSSASPSGYATDGGFPAQMGALSELFDATTLVLPCAPGGSRPGETVLTGSNLTVTPLRPLPGSGWRRKTSFPWWTIRSLSVIRREFQRADAVHAPIPGDVGTIGMLLALAARKPLLVRYCNNWFVTRTLAQRFWKWAMVRTAGGRNVMFATGGADEAPSARNPEVRWIFATSLHEREIAASARPRDHLPGAHPRLILVGRQESGKGTDILIESLPEIARRFPGVTLDVLGAGSALSGFERLASDAGVRDRVKFWGNVDRSTVVRLLQAADLFCFPTASEGFPKVVVEALACGLPVLTTRVSVLPRLLSRGAGIVLDELSTATLADGVRRCLSDEAAYRAMSARAIEISRDYSLERWKKTLEGSLSAAWGPLRSEPRSGFEGEPGPPRATGPDSVGNGSAIRQTGTLL